MFEDFLQSQKVHLSGECNLPEGKGGQKSSSSSIPYPASASEVAKIRDGTGMFGM